MTNDVSKIRIGLTVAFAVAVLALITELCCVLWRRRRFRRQNPSGESDINTRSSSSSSVSNCSIPSKELLYFFCWKSQLSRIEPADGGVARPVFHSVTAHHDDPQEPIDLFKLQEMYGSSRVLFTIKEDEKEEETEQQQQFSDDQKSSTEKKRVCLKEWFEDAKTETQGGGEEEEEEEEESPVMVVVNIDHQMDLELETPFSTPCASPPYYTPTPSPSHVDLTHTVTIKGHV